MSKSDIANMSVNERLQLMEEIWTSFERDTLDIPVPIWHQEILQQRGHKDDGHFVAFEDAKQTLYKAFNAYKNF
jgi:hypothetical protein